MYGTWPAGGTQPTWLADLNFDPRMRAAAGFGVRAVRADQDNLIASAWNQFEQLRQANQRLRQFQLARVVAQTTLTRHVNAVEGSGAFLQLTRPMHTRLRVTLDTTATLNAHLAASRISAGVVAPAFRRLARRRGPLGRRLFAPASPPSQIVERLNQVAGTPRALAIVGALIAPAGTVLLDAVSTDTPSTLLNATAVDGAPGWRAAAVAGPAVSAARTLPQRPPINLKNDPDAPVWLRTGPKTFPDAPDFPDRFSDFLLMEARFRAAATQVVNYINQRTALISDEPELPQLTATLATAQTLMTAALDPTRTLVVRASAQFVLPSAGDPLRPQIGAPVFTRPMSLALTSQQMLPGVEAVPDETVALLVTNPRFVEAYMVGLNDEMRRELAWRQYPVISTATFFANFWGNSPDIPPIASWPPGASLGLNTDSSTAQAVLLVRGEFAPAISQYRDHGRPGDGHARATSARHERDHADVPRDHRAGHDILRLPVLGSHRDRGARLLLRAGRASERAEIRVGGDRQGNPIDARGLERPRLVAGDGDQQPRQRRQAARGHGPRRGLGR
jgi:hypothetical protein